MAREEIVRERRDDEPRREGSPLGWILALLLIILTIGLVWWFLTSRDLVDNNGKNDNQNQKFADEVKVEGMRQTLPSHGEVVPALPANVVVYAKEKQGTNSTIKIENGGTEYGEGNTRIESNGQIIRRDIRDSAPEGIYRVTYRLCESGSQCREGSYEFEVDMDSDDGYVDRTNQRQVEITINEDGLSPKNVTISSGTRLTWRNRSNDSYILYPGKEEFKDVLGTINSGQIRENSTYSLTVRERGYFVYFAENGENLEGKVIVK